jgi:hypothetical protein
VHLQDQQSTTFESTSFVWDLSTHMPWPVQWFVAVRQVELEVEQMGNERVEGCLKGRLTWGWEVEA